MQCIILNKISICYLPLKNMLPLILKSILILVLSFVILLLSSQIWPYIQGVYDKNQNRKYLPQIFSIPIVPSNVESVVFNDDTKVSLQFSIADGQKISKGETRVSIKLAKDMIKQKKARTSTQNISSRFSLGFQRSRPSHRIWRIFRNIYQRCRGS